MLLTLNAARSSASLSGSVLNMKDSHHSQVES